MGSIGAGEIMVFSGIGLIAAYFGNIMGFRDWFNSNISHGDPIIDGEFGDGNGDTTSTTSPCSGKNVTWVDPNFAKCSNGAVCWSNTPCGGTKKVSVCGEHYTRDSIREAWLAKYKCKTPATKPPVVTPKPVTCPKCGNCYTQTKSPDGKSCYCKFNGSMLTYNDANCKSTCDGYSCWTNYPCPNLGARAQKCVKGTCAQARAAWIAAFGCKSSLARAYNVGMERITIG